MTSRCDIWPWTEATFVVYFMGKSWVVLHKTRALDPQFFFFSGKKVISCPFILAKYSFRVQANTTLENQHVFKSQKRPRFIWDCVLDYWKMGRSGRMICQTLLTIFWIQKRKESLIINSEYKRCLLSSGNVIFWFEAQIPFWGYFARSFHCFDCWLLTWYVTSWSWSKILSPARKTGMTLLKGKLIITFLWPWLKFFHIIVKEV